jgi:outer membrane protein assembly factor BamE
MRRIIASLVPAAAGQAFGPAAFAAMVAGATYPPLALCHPMKFARRRCLHLPLLLACAAMGAGCDALQRTDSFMGFITPYRIPIVQGNAITKEQAALIRPGLTRLQVRDVLGSPLLTDPFHAARWDYVFTLRREGAEPQRRMVVVQFEGDRVKSMQAPADLPSEREFVAQLGGKPDRTAARLELSEEERQALPPPKVREAAPPEPIGAVREYPPLEAS